MVIPIKAASTHQRKCCKLAHSEEYPRVSSLLPGAGHESNQLSVGYELPDEILRILLSTGSEVRRPDIATLTLIGIYVIKRRPEGGVLLAKPISKSVPTTPTAGSTTVNDHLFLPQMDETKGTSDDPRRA